MFLNVYTRSYLKKNLYLYLHPSAVFPGEMRCVHVDSCRCQSFTVFLWTQIPRSKCTFIYKLLVKVATWHCARSLPVYALNVFFVCIFFVEGIEAKLALRKLKLYLGMFRDRHGDAGWGSCTHIGLASWCPHGLDVTTFITWGHHTYPL